MKGPFGDQKIQKKVAQCQKNSKGGPTVSFGCVSYVKNGISERGTLSTNLDVFPFAGPVV